MDGHVEYISAQTRVDNEEVDLLCHLLFCLELKEALCISWKH